MSHTSSFLSWWFMLWPANCLITLVKCFFIIRFIYDFRQHRCQRSSFVCILVKCHKILPFGVGLSLNNESIMNFLSAPVLCLSRFDAWRRTWASTREWRVSCSQWAPPSTWMGLHCTRQWQPSSSLRWMAFRLIGARLLQSGEISAAGLQWWGQIANETPKNMASLTITDTWLCNRWPLFSLQYDSHIGQCRRCQYSQRRTGDHGSDPHCGRATHPGHQPPGRCRLVAVSSSALCYLWQWYQCWE